MENKNLIPAVEFCRWHDIEISFVSALGQSGLLEITTIEGNAYLDPGELDQAERMIRLHAELGINAEGVEAISYLLERVEQMQHEIMTLRNRLTLYETGF